MGKKYTQYILMMSWKSFKLEFDVAFPILNHELMYDILKELLNNTILNSNFVVVVFRSHGKFFYLSI